MTEPRTKAGRQLLANWNDMEGTIGVGALILAIEAEAAAAERARILGSAGIGRLARCSPNLLADWGTRTERGDKITAAWGEPDENGIYEPIFTVHADDNLIAAERARIRAAVLAAGRRH